MNLAEEGDSAWWPSVLKVTIYLFSFLFVQYLCVKIGTVYMDKYDDSSLIWSSLTKYNFAFLGLAIVAFAAVAFGIFKRNSICIRVVSPWQSLQQGHRIRLFVCFVSFIVVWPAITLGYNYYFDQYFLVDRLVLALLFILLWWRPVFIYPLIVLTTLLLFQAKQPDLGGSIMAHKLQVINALYIFAGAFLVYIIFNARNLSVYVFLTCCYVASAYWLPAFTKIQLGWFDFGSLSHVPLASYAHGWLNFLAVEQVVNFSKFVEQIDLPLKLLVILFEAGSILFMLYRGISMLLLVCLITFHFAVFVLLGFFFWTWILLDVAVLILLFKDRKLNSFRIYNKPYFIISIPLIFFCQYWANPPALAWFDTRASYTFELQAETDSGEKMAIPPEYFRPYEDVFTMQAFNYLVKQHNQLLGPYGVTNNRKIANDLEQPLSAAQFLEMEREDGHNYYNEKRKKQFNEFVLLFIQNRNKRVNTPLLEWESFAPPKQFWGDNSELKNLDGKIIKQVTIVGKTTLFDDEQVEIIRQIELSTLIIPSGN